VIALDLKGLAVSTGAGLLFWSHRTVARSDSDGYCPHDRAKASIRFSLGKQSTLEDVDFALSVIPETVARLRQLSPLWSKIAVSG